MQNKDSLVEELDTVHGFHEFTQIFQEISVMRMQRIRQRVLKNREFQAKLGEIYYDVKQSHDIEVAEIEKKKKKKTPLDFLLKPKRSLSILITANDRMYGDIFHQVFALFKEHIMAQKTDIMVIGKLGKHYFDIQNINQKYLYLELPDREIKYDDLYKVIDVLFKYDNVNVFYGRFENIMIQKPDMTNLTGDTVEQLKSSVFGNYTTALLEKPVQFLFEPSLENVLHFFDTQVFASLFKQSIHESDLARFASRIQSLEKASINIEQRIKSLKSELTRIDKLIDNKKQIERMSGMAIWNK